jgi:hypothetical protein
MATFRPRRWTPDLGLWTIIALAAAVRLAFALRPPPFITPDSQGYFLPGWELAHGLGFGPELRRTPTYPLFIGLVVFLLGDDLRGLTLAQHGLGVLTAGLTYTLGRRAFGRLAGLLAGFAVALSGPLLVYEHTLMTEALFTLLVTLAVLMALLALRRPTRGRLLAAGLALAAASLTRPVAEVLLPLLPLALLAHHRAWRPALRGTAWFGLGLGLLLLPWMARNALAHGTFSAEGALGQALIGRTVRHDDYRKFYRCPTDGQVGAGDSRPADSLAPPQDGALGIICEEAVGEPSGGTITQRVRDELGLSQTETSNVLRQLAISAIARRPAYYLTGSFKMAGEILVGKRETVIAPWRERTTRNWDNKWDPRLTPLVQHPPPAEGPEYERADALVSFFQPFRWRTQLGQLLALGLLAAVARPSWRPALIVPIAAGAIVLASAALDGNVWRYRYPVDPLLAVTVGGGGQALRLAGAWIVRQLTSAAGGRRPAATAEARRPEPAAVVERGA